MYTIDDIDIFVLTHNRAHLLTQTLENLLAQRAGVKRITVLDNDSTDHTPRTVRSFASRGVKYVTTSGFLGNYRKAKELVARPYCMLFHDDDLLHPDYLTHVLKAINTYKNVNLVTSAYTPFADGSNLPFQPAVPDTHYCFASLKEWASYLFLIEGVSYAPAVYRTEYFQTTPLEYEKFGKYNDWPLLCKMGQYPGAVVFFNHPDWLHCRKHPGQDSACLTNRLTLQQIAEWNLFFYQAMGRPGPLSRLYYAYGLKCKQYLEGKYNRELTAAYKAAHPPEELKVLVRARGCMWSLRSHPLKFLFYPLAASAEKEILSRQRHFD